MFLTDLNQLLIGYCERMQGASDSHNHQYFHAMRRGVKVTPVPMKETLAIVSQFSSFQYQLLM